MATSDASVLHSLTNPVANGYDLLSVRPLSDKVFLQCCGSLSVDIVSLDLTGRLEFYLKRQQVKQVCVCVCVYMLYTTCYYFFHYSPLRLLIEELLLKSLTHLSSKVSGMDKSPQADILASLDLL